MGWQNALLLGIVAAIAPTLVQKDEAAAVKQRLLGSWRLVTWEEHDRSGRVNHPLGPNALGQITYTPDGRMSAQLMRPGSKRFANDDWRKATPDEKSSAWSNYFGYFGTYRIDLAQKAVIHRIEGSWFPNLLGTDQIRHFRFESNRLILDADTDWGNVHIVWEKIAP
jgi:hypothetical protein